MSYTPRPIGRKKSARTAWIVVAIVAIVAIAAIIIAIIFTSNQVGPNPTPTVSPTPSPTKTGTATPTVTPTLSPTPSPTAKPSPSGSGSPSPSPSANPAQAWADQTYGTFATLAWSHTGDAVVRLPQLLGGKIKGGILTFTNNAADDSDFIVQVFDQNGDEMGDPLIDLQGDYAGTVGYGLAAPEISSDSVPTTVQVSSSGNWAVEIAPVSAAPMGFGDYSGDKVILIPAPKNNTLIANYGLIGGHFGMTYYYQNQLFQVLVPNTGGQVPNQSFALNGVPGVIAVLSGGPWSVAQPN